MTVDFRFKMKKQGTFILGDATYRACGVQVPLEEGLFEVHPPLSIVVILQEI